MIQNLLPWVADALVVFGLAIMSIAVYGMVWLPDIYTRLHAASKIAAFGVLPILFVSIVVGGPALGGRAVLISVFILLTTPVSAHAIARAAYLMKEPMNTPEILDESDRLQGHGSAERLSN